jgi:hypothetical protein
MTWEVSPILAPLIAEVKAKYPFMTVGTIGDTAHQAEKSDHDPDKWDWVCAADFMIGDQFTAGAAQALFDRLHALLPARMAYVIYDRQIVSTQVSAGKVRPYTGTDPHTNHVHVSVKHAQLPRPTTSWNIYPKVAPAMDEQSIASKLGADLNTDASGVAKGVARQVDRALGDNLAALNARIDAMETKLDTLLTVLTALPPAV